MRVVVKDHLEVPKEIKLRSENVDSCADVVFFQQVPFLIAISERLKFIAIGVPTASGTHTNSLEALIKHLGF